ncbi:MAG TPA: group II intron reverse transcriptase/maturase [Steroidobacteraceae bacterium]|nr:group II intron reverse transcriptase/maturase [Steroidobacteraceae bacterium]
MCREDILQFAYLCCKSNGGAAGVDGQEFTDIESYGRERWLGELVQELREKKYQPQAVRRVFIPKRGGTGRRPLGIPSIRDRTVQMAAVLVLGPIIEADLPSEQYAYRPERNALSAVRQVYHLLKTGHTKVIDADLAAYFDSIPHFELLRSVARRVVDRQMLHLIQMWLTAPVEETDRRGNTKRTTRNRDEKRGIPQGSPLSPLLSNIYMRRFVLGWQQLGYAERYKARIVNYADDFVICCRGNAFEALQVMRQIMGRLRLTINEEKTHYCRVPRQHFDFLGYTFGRYYSFRSGRAYLSAKPSKKSIRRQIESIREKTAKRRTLLPAEQIVTELNDGLRGWANYFALGPVEDAYRAIERYVTRRLRRWLCIKHEIRGSGSYRFTDQYLHDTLGLVCIRDLVHNLPWAIA